MGGVMVAKRKASPGKIGVFPGDDSVHSDRAPLRRRAEEAIRSTNVWPAERLEAEVPEEIRQTLHELRVHQIELELQNEELRQTQAELDAIRERYFDLFDLAPVGYCTVDEKGLIQEANLTVVKMLDVIRSDLNKKPISRFIHKEDQDIFYLKKNSSSQPVNLRNVSCDCSKRTAQPSGHICGGPWYKQKMEFLYAVW